MGLLKRVSRLVQVNFPAPARTEDPELLLEQSIAQMQTELLQLRQAIAQAIATQKHCERQQSQVEGLATDWQQRAQLALQRGEEPLAREALQRRLPYLEESRNLQTQIEEQRHLICHFKKVMYELEIKLDEARARKDMLVARVRAEATMPTKPRDVERWFTVLEREQPGGETASL